MQPSPDSGATWSGREGESVKSRWKWDVAYDRWGGKPRPQHPFRHASGSLPRSETGLCPRPSDPLFPARDCAPQAQRSRREGYVLCRYPGSQGGLPITSPSAGRPRYTINKIKQGPVSMEPLVAKFRSSMLCWSWLQANQISRTSIVECQALNETCFYSSGPRSSHFLSMKNTFV
ncbi:hypothetical protein L209DRAFT_64696 [Thermothelomyces heterothallicus CBS 203.75]